MTNQTIGMILSLCGMGVNIVSYQVKNKLPLLILQTVGSTLFMISYVFSGGGIGVILNVLMLLRNFLFMYLGKREGRVVKIACIALCLSYVITYAVYTLIAKEAFVDNLFNFLPIVAAFFGTVSFANNNVNKLRMWKYGDSICWLIYNLNIGIGALGGIVGEILNQISLTVGIFRYREKKPTVSYEQQSKTE